MADTDNIGPWRRFADLQNTHLSAAIAISGLGSFDLVDASHTWIGQGCCAGLGADLGWNWVTINESALINVGYGLDASLGPVLDTSPDDVDQFNGVFTSGGALSFSSMNSVTFTAVPEPKLSLLLGLGLVTSLGRRPVLRLRL